MLNIFFHISFSVFAYFLNNIDKVHFLEKCLNLLV